MLEFRCLYIFIIAVSLKNEVEGHGMMLNPPSRSSLWRFGYKVPVNYDDNGLYCGGYGAQWGENHGLCGECGDNWASSRPRDNEEGGKYGRGIISAKYLEGQDVKVKIHLTASHKGHFEFRLCPKYSANELVQQSCLDQHVLQMADGSGSRFFIPTYQTGFYYPVIRLPKGVTCANCVLQWHYTAGNRWGLCQNGTGALGCGSQETFRNCADIAILPVFLTKKHMFAKQTP